MGIFAFYKTVTDNDSTLFIFRTMAYEQPRPQTAHEAKGKGQPLDHRFGQLSQDACIQQANPEHAYGHSNGTGVRYRFHTGGVCRRSSDAESRTVTIDLRY